MPTPINHTMMTDILRTMRLLEFSDSAFPVGTFSFSNGLESAAEIGLVHDAATLEGYTAEIARQAAFTDGIAAIQTLRGCHTGLYDTVLYADEQVILCKMNAEARQMTQRMGKKLTELACRIIEDPLLLRFRGDIEQGRTAGCYPTAQALLFAACGLDEQALFAAHQYGVINMVLSAALRCVRVSHYDTQQILFRLSEQIPTLYTQVSTSSFDDMHTFTPQIDIVASLHEQGTKRMFMN